MATTKNITVLLKEIPFNSQFWEKYFSKTSLRKNQIDLVLSIFEEDPRKSFHLIFALIGTQKLDEFQIWRILNKFVCDEYIETFIKTQKLPNSIMSYILKNFNSESIMEIVYGYQKLTPEQIDYCIANKLALDFLHPNQHLEHMQLVSLIMNLTTAVGHNRIRELVEILPKKYIPSLLTHPDPKIRNIIKTFFINSDARPNESIL